MTTFPLCHSCSPGLIEGLSLTRLSVPALLSVIFIFWSYFSYYNIKQLKTGATDKCR